MTKKISTTTTRLAPPGSPAAAANVLDLTAATPTESTKRKRTAGKRVTGAQSRGGKTISRSARAKKTTSPTDEEIRIRAYFIAEQRYRFGTTGDAASDWLKAKNQLISERSDVQKKG